MMAIRKNKNGFTLIELLIVVGIIAILIAIAVPSYIGQRKKAAMSEAISNLQSIRLLEEQFFAENGRYAPDTDSDLATPEQAFFDIARDPNPPAPTPANSIVAFLRGFRPGRARDLNYNYDITVPDPNGPAGVPSFVAFARPKAGTIVSNRDPLDTTDEFWINDRNQNNF